MIRRAPARRPWWTVLLLLVAAAQPSARSSGEYRSVEVEGLKITVDSEWGSRTAPGYLPVRFDIINTGDPRIIDIVGEGTRFFRTIKSPSQPGGARIHQAVRLARGDHVRLTLPVPIFAESENLRFDIEENGRTLERFNYIGFQSGAAPTDAAALIVAEPASPFGSLAKGWPRPMSGMGARMFGPGARSSTLDFMLEPARLPDNWIGYTALRAVIIGRDEWDRLNEAQRSALLTWTACGGDLIVADGDAATLPRGGQDPVAGAAGAAAHAYFFGRIYTPTSASIGEMGLAAFLSNAAKLQDANWALPANRASDWGVIAARGFRLPIPGLNGIPARAYLSILIVFALLIGPANYWFLRRRNQQVLFVLTAPLISAVFILLLAGYVVAAEGFSVSGRAVTFTVLDQARKEAATRASASLYAAGMTPAGGLRFARDVAVFPIGAEGIGDRDTQVLELTESQRFSSGVIHARAPTNFEQIAFRPARERVSFAAGAGGMAAINGLGVTILKLFYRTGGKTYQLSGSLADGARAAMTPAAAGGASLVPPDIPLAARLVYLMAQQPEGSYLAVVEQSPFWDPGVPGITERRSVHVVLGWPGGQP
jgi:hypothetical protein